MLGVFRRLGGFHLPYVFAQEPYVDPATLIQKLALYRRNIASGLCGHGPSKRPEDGGEHVFQGKLLRVYRQKYQNLRKLCKTPAAPLLGASLPLFE